MKPRAAYTHLQSGVEVAPLVYQLAAHPELWDKNNARLQTAGPHRETHDIWLHYKDQSENLASQDWRNFGDQHFPIWYPAAAILTEAQPLIFGLMSAVQGEMLGGVLL